MMVGSCGREGGGSRHKAEPEAGPRADNSSRPTGQRTIKVYQIREVIEENRANSTTASGRTARVLWIRNTVSAGYHCCCYSTWFWATGSFKDTNPCMGQLKPLPPFKCDPGKSEKSKLKNLKIPNYPNPRGPIYIEFGSCKNTN